MSEKSCEKCEHWRSDVGCIDEHAGPIWNPPVNLAPICKHYTERPKPSAFKQAFHALSEKYAVDADWQMAAFMWNARGVADGKAVKKVGYCFIKETQEELQDAIRELKEQSHE